jgi:hypothetical protein
MATSIWSPPGFSRIRSIMCWDSSMPSTRTPAARSGKAIRPVPTANSRASAPLANPARNLIVSSSSPRVSTAS